MLMDDLASAARAKATKTLRMSLGPIKLATPAVPAADQTG